MEETWIGRLHGCKEEEPWIKSRGRMPRGDWEGWVSLAI